MVNLRPQSGLQVTLAKSRLSAIDGIVLILNLNHWFVSGFVEADEQRLWDALGQQIRDAFAASLLPQRQFGCNTVCEEGQGYD